MKKTIIGAILVIFGLPGTAFFFSDLISLVAGALPILLIIGGALAFYLGYEDLMAEKNRYDAEPTADHTDEADAGLNTPAKGMASAESEDSPKQEEIQEPEKEPVSSDEPAGFVGNTDTQVFHSTACNFSQGKKCTVQFQDRDQAIAQGYKPCKVCNP